jgi:catechol 2,3-dioxygenase-like lactoylglutathione lyase family enzyme
VTNDTVAPEFFVRDIDASMRFYIDGLGFRFVRRSDDFAVVAHGTALFLLAMPSAVPGEHAAAAVEPWLASGPRGVGVNVLVMVDDVDAMYARVREFGAPIFWEIGDRYYGLRDFIVTDPDGYMLRLGAPVK